MLLQGDSKTYSSKKLPRNSKTCSDKKLPRMSSGWSLYDRVIKITMGCVNIWKIFTGSMWPLAVCFQLVSLRQSGANCGVQPLIQKWTDKRSSPLLFGQFVCASPRLVVMIFHIRSQINIEFPFVAQMWNWCCFHSLDVWTNPLRHITQSSHWNVIYFVKPNPQQCNKNAKSNSSLYLAT